MANSLLNVQNDSYKTAAEFHNDFFLANIVSADYTDAEKRQLQLYSIFMIIVGSLILVTNLIVVISSGLIIKNGQSPKSAYMHLGNASLAHMFIGASVIFGRMPKRYISHNLCVLQVGMITSGAMTSMYSVGLVAVDRFVYILHNNYYKKRGTTKNVRISIILVWILGIVLGYMPITGWAGDTMNGHKCWYMKLMPPRLIVINAVIGVLPVPLVCVLYCIILYHALKKVKQLKYASSSDRQDSTEEDNKKLRVFRGGNVGSSNQSINTIASSDMQLHSQKQIRTIQPQINPIPLSRKNTVQVIFATANKRQPTKWKAIKVVLFTTGSFVCTWVPYFICSLIFVSCMDDKDQTKCRRVEGVLTSPLAILALCNSLLNPVIYAWWHEGFRRSLKNIFSRQMRICKMHTGDLRQTNSSSEQLSHVTNIQG